MSVRYFFKEAKESSSKNINKLITESVYVLLSHALKRSIIRDPQRKGDD